MISRRVSSKLLMSVLVLGALGCQTNGAPISKETTTAQPAAANAATDAPVLDECPHASADNGSCDHAAPPSSDNKHFGSSFTLADAQSLQQAVKSGGAEGTAGTDKGRTVRVNGTVESVCQKAGCWMVLQDGDVKARVFTKQNRFFLPRDIAGKRASVEGQLQTRTVSEKFAKHLEEDRGGDPSKVTGPTKELLLYASVVELQ